MEAERKLKRAKINLMRSPKFALLSGILMVGKTTLVREGRGGDGTVISSPLPVTTAMTNGRDEFYAESFVMQLADPELAFVIAHEAAHKMYRHLTTWRKLYDEDADLANQACDYVINIMLHDLDPQHEVIRMPRDKDGKLMGLLDQKYRGMNAKQVFDLLKQKKDDECQSGGGGGEGNQLDQHDWDGAQSLSDAEKVELAKEIDAAIRQGLVAQKKVGDKKGGLHRELQDLLEPKVDWRDVLREFVKSTCRSKDTSSWRRVNRRYLSSDIYMPSLIGEKIGHIAVGVDTSGSIGPELVEFLSEVRAIAEEIRPDRVDLMYWDAAVASHEEYDESSVSTLATSTRPKGGGGTRPQCVVDYINEKSIKPECIVMLTDGCVPNWGDGWSAPVLWVIAGGANVTADNGKTIVIK